MLLLIFIAICAIGYYMYRRDHPRVPIEKGPVNRTLTHIGWVFMASAVMALIIYNLAQQA